MDTRIVNHRRDRQQTRRILAQICLRGRDLAGSDFLRDLDLLDGQRHAPANDNRKDFVVTAQVSL